jgi:hypothetical protein
MAGGLTFGEDDLFILIAGSYCVSVPMIGYFFFGNCCKQYIPLLVFYTHDVSPLFCALLHLQQSPFQLTHQEGL